MSDEGSQEKRRPRCQFLMRYMGRSYCRWIWQKDLLAPADELPFGCPADCARYHAAFPTDWADTAEPEVDPKIGRA